MTDESIDLDEFEQEKIEEIISNEEAVDGNIAQVELKIKQLEQKKQQLLQQKADIGQKKQERFEEIAEKYGLDPEQSYKYEDGTFKQMESQDIAEQDLQGGM